MAATPAQASLETSLTTLNDDGRALLFTEARTANTFSDRPVARPRSALILPTQRETSGLFSRISALFGELASQPNVARHGHEAS